MKFNLESMLDKIEQYDKALVKMDGFLASDDPEKIAAALITLNRFITFTIKEVDNLELQLEQ